MISSLFFSNVPTFSDFIKKIRNCKTAAQERELVSEEKSQIRDSMNINSNDYELASLNLQKLIFINILGHDTDFGQMLALRLITQGNYSQKKFGYLGLTQLFTTKSEVLVLATQTLRSALTRNHPWEIALALTSISEIGTEDICRDLSDNIIDLILNPAHNEQSGVNYVQKKALLTAIKIANMCPEKVQLIADKVEVALYDAKHNSFNFLKQQYYLDQINACLSLICEIVKISPNIINQFQAYIPEIVTLFIKVLKRQFTHYSADVDFDGVADPFLQVQILQFLKCFGSQEKQLDEMTEILAQVITNTTGAKNSANAVIYENIRTIMAVQCPQSLKNLAITYLGKFLQNNDTNSKYISLLTILKIVEYESTSVQKYKELILDCLQNTNDITLQKLSLKIMGKIANEKNVKEIVEQLLEIVEIFGEKHPLFKELIQNVKIKNFIIVFNRFHIALKNLRQIANDISIQCLNVSTMKKVYLAIKAFLHSCM